MLFVDSLIEHIGWWIYAGEASMRLMANASIFHINKDISWRTWITRAKERRGTCKLHFQSLQFSIVNEFQTAKSSQSIVGCQRWNWDFSMTATGWSAVISINFFMAGSPISMSNYENARNQCARCVVAAVWAATNATKDAAKCTFEILTCHFVAFNVQFIRCDNRLMNLMQHQRWQSRGDSSTSIKLDMKIDR